MNDLKCPFCGSDYTLKVASRNPHYNGLLVWATIGCARCGYNTKFEGNYLSCQLGRSDRNYDTWNKKYDDSIVNPKKEIVKRKALEWWNTRV